MDRAGTSNETKGRSICIWYVNNADRHSKCRQFAVDWLFEELAEDHAFALHSHTAYLYGLCDACIAESSGNKDNHEKKG